MKRTLLFITSLLLIVGCSKEPINYETTLVNREGVFYTNDTNKPYSGSVFSLYGDGKKKDEGTLKDGKMIRKTEWRWYVNGQREFEVTYKDEKEDGLGTEWYEKGQKKSELTYKNGVFDGLGTVWYENGQKQFEGIHKDGKPISSKEWNEDGSVMN
jgi:antitoxin component YwqK of YwqJK toxin-antitoxin module